MHPETRCVLRQSLNRNCSLITWKYSSTSTSTCTPRSTAVNVLSYLAVNKVSVAPSGPIRTLLVNQLSTELRSDHVSNDIIISHTTDAEPDLCVEFPVRLSVCGSEVTSGRPRGGGGRGHWRRGVGVEGVTVCKGDYSSSSSSSPSSSASLFLFSP